MKIWGGEGDNSEPKVLRRKELKGKIPNRQLPEAHSSGQGGSS